MSRANNHRKIKMHFQQLLHLFYKLYAIEAKNRSALNIFIIRVSTVIYTCNGNKSGNIPVDLDCVLQYRVPAAETKWL